MCILSYIYGSNSLELGEDIELFYVVQDFCLVTVCGRMVVAKSLQGRSIYNPKVILDAVQGLNRGDGSANSSSERKRP